MTDIEPTSSEDDDHLAKAIRRQVAPLGGVELPPHPPTDIGEPASFEWPSADEKAEAVAQAKSLSEQAAEGGLRFEAYLPPGLATWLLGLIEQGHFIDPSEAVFVMLGEQRDLEGFPDLRQELLGRGLRAAMDGSGQCFSSEEIEERMIARFSKPRSEPAKWQRKVSAEGTD